MDLYGKRDWTIRDFTKELQQTSRGVKKSVDDLAMLLSVPEIDHNQIPFQSSRELLYELCNVLARQKVKTNLDGVPSSIVQLEEYYRSRQNELRQVVDDVLDRLKSIQSTLDGLGGAGCNTLSGWPKTVYMCFLCGSVGATKCKITLYEIKECMETLWNARLQPVNDTVRKCQEMGEWQARNQTAGNQTPDLSTAPSVLVAENMLRGHLGQAFNNTFKPQACCNTCRRVRAPQELFNTDRSTVGYPAHRCGEFLASLRCRLVEHYLFSAREEESVDGSFDGRIKFLHALLRSIEVSEKEEDMAKFLGL